MKVVVLGSGIIGISTAWWLRQAGHDVVVIDRESGPAQEASRANGGQISVSYAEPWANPQAPMKMLRWLMRDDAPLRYKFSMDPKQWLWGLAFLRECLPSRLEPNIRAMVRMAEYSRSTLQEMRSTLDIEYSGLQRGILNFYRNPKEFEDSQKAADVMRDFGVDRRIVSADEVIEIEPALTHIANQIVGGDYTADDESGDCHEFAVELAALAEQAGVEFRYSTQVSRLVAVGGAIDSVEVIGPDGLYSNVKADSYIAALGVHTPQYVSSLGVSCLVYPAKGYSATFQIKDESSAPFVSLTDSEHKVVYTRMGNTLRMAGTAEVSGYSRALSSTRCASMKLLARELFPEMLGFDDVQFWSGLRPSTPSNVPLIGRTKISNLYLNTGHGTLGWTMGVGSGRALADLVSGKTPELEFPFIG